MYFFHILIVCKTVSFGNLKLLTLKKINHMMYSVNNIHKKYILHCQSKFNEIIAVADNITIV